MTIPTRPAPAPPVSRLCQNESASANASIERLRLQLQQQQQQGGTQKLTIKIPPPPKGPISNGLHNPTRTINNSTNNNTIDGSNSSSITRKFPQARYTPTTNWDDSPFESGIGTNGNFKKVPPPRPPPPKVQVNGRKQLAPTPPIQSANILANIFHRKKNSKTSNSSASRIYGVSSGISNGTSSHSSLTTNSYSAASSWNTNWNTSTNGSSSYYSTGITTTTTTSTSNGPAEAQLISFDSPPSSPTFTQKSNSDCVSVDSFSSDSNFSSPNNGSVSQPESGFEDDFSATRSRPATTSPLDPWETLDAFSATDNNTASYNVAATSIGTAPVRNLTTINTRILASQDNPLCNGKSLLPPAPSLSMPTIIKPKISQKPKAPKPPSFLKQNVNSYILDEDPPTPPSPPMPQCPPPPPPGGVSLLDVISGKADALSLDLGATNCVDTSQPYGLALYNFDGVEEGDLNFRENDKIYLLEQVSAEWFRGRTRAGCEGIFPVNYIDIKVPLATKSSTATAVGGATGSTLYGSNSTSKTNHSLPRLRCLYNFPSEVEDDLALKENDLVTILYRINEDWLYGEIDGRQGQFPANFLEYVPDNIPMP